MSMKYIRDYYGVPAKRGGRVRYTGAGRSRLGTITSAMGSHLRIRLDGDVKPGYFHPLWKLEYLPPDPTEAAPSRAASRMNGETL